MNDLVLITTQQRRCTLSSLALYNYVYNVPSFLFLQGYYCNELDAVIVVDKHALEDGGVGQWEHATTCTLVHLFLTVGVTSVHRVPPLPLSWRTAVVSSACCALITVTPNLDPQYYSLYSPAAAAGGSDLPWPPRTDAQPKQRGFRKSPLTDSRKSPAMALADQLGSDAVAKAQAAVKRGQPLRYKEVMELMKQLEERMEEALGAPLQEVSDKDRVTLDDLRRVSSDRHFNV